MFRNSLFAAILLCTAAQASAGTLIVSSAGNDGAGSLRAALAAASANDAPSLIVIDAQGDIRISETLVYDGTAPLSIIGSDQVVVSDENITLLAITEGANLDITRLAFRGPGGFDINNRDATRAGKGVFVAVPNEQTGNVTLSLDRVSVMGVAGHGIHVSDCDLGDNCGGGGGGVGGGSAASISVILREVTVRDVGNGDFDADGLRVDERGPGNISARIWSSQFMGIGADGVELDEGQAGSVLAEVAGTQFVNNGIYCSPDVLSDFVPDPDELEFQEGARARANIPGNVIGTPDDACIELSVDLYGDGSVEAYEFSIDVDDGFDIDEAGPGGINVSLFDVAVSGNLDEGLDLDEEDAGGIRMTILGGTYSGNADDGIKLSEQDEGDITVALVETEAMANGGTGFVFEEENSGDLDIKALNVAARGNGDGDETGLEAKQDDAGKGFVAIAGPKIADGMDLDGVDLR